MAITLPFRLQPGTADRTITDAQYIRNSFICVDTVDQLDSLIKGYGSSNKIEDGTPIYVSTQSKLYIFRHSAKNYQNLSSIDFLKTDIQDGKIYGWKDGQYTDISSLLANFTEEQLEALNSGISKQSIDLINNQISELNDKTINLLSKKSSDYDEVTLSAAKKGKGYLIALLPGGDPKKVSLDSLGNAAGGTFKTVDELDTAAPEDSYQFVNIK